MLAVLISNMHRGPKSEPHRKINFMYIEVYRPVSGRGMYDVLFVFVDMHRITIRVQLPCYDLKLVITIEPTPYPYASAAQSNALYHGRSRTGTGVSDAMANAG